MTCRVPQQQAEAGVAGRKVAAELGDGRVVVRQLLKDRERLAVLGRRFRWLARILQLGAEVVMAYSQVAAEFGDGGVVVGKLLIDCQCLAVLGRRFR